jgi:hypothetical protein
MLAPVVYVYLAGRKCLGELREYRDHSYAVKARTPSLRQCGKGTLSEFLPSSKAGEVFL